MGAGSQVTDLAAVRWVDVRVPSSIMTLIAGLIGSFLTVFLITYPGWSLTDSEQEFLESSSGSVWLVLLAAEGLLCGILIIPMWRLARLLWRSTERSWRAVGASIVAFGVVVTPTVVTGFFGKSFDSPLRDDQLKLFTFSVAAAFNPVLAAFGISVLDSIVIDRSWGGDGDAGPERLQLISLERVRELLDMYLLVIGATIALAVLATAALRSALVDPPSQALVWAYAAFYSLLLAVLYGSTLVKSRLKSRHVIDHFHPLPDPSHPLYQPTTALRGELYRRLRLSESPLATIKVALGIVAPLLGAIPAALLG
jgi:hypothetical protein